MEQVVLDVLTSCGLAHRFDWERLRPFTVRKPILGWDVFDNKVGHPDLRPQSLDFIGSTPQDQPLLLFIGIRYPHYRADPPDQDEGTFAGITPWRPESFNEQDVSDKPLWVRNLGPLSQTEQDSLDVFYQRRLESLQSVDRDVQAVLQALEDTGRLTNTIVVFTSDHGIALGEHRQYRSKNSPYEESVRVPLLVRAPDALVRQDATSQVSLVDIAPTVFDYAGIPVPEGVRGHSIRPLLVDGEGYWPDGTLYESGFGKARHVALRTARWTYVEYLEGERELYDRWNDPHQMQNVESVFADTIPLLRERLDQLKAK